MSSSFPRRFLRIDLSNRRYQAIPVPHALIEQYVGGRGFAAKMVWDLIPPHGDPLGLENVLMFLTGPLTGLAPCARSMLAFKSPLTGTYGDSYHGGFLGAEIRYAGFDGILIEGEAETPVYLLIEDDRVEFRDARHLWGLDTGQLYRAMRDEIGSGRYELACIGPAGENKVRFALVDCSPHRQSGRGGGGAVMGAKKLKAIVVRGSHRLAPARPDHFLAAVRQAYANLQDAPGALDFHHYATLSGIVDDSEKGILPTYNYQQASFKYAEELLGKQYQARIWLRHSACIGCPIACGKVGVIRRGPYAGTVCDNVEFETTGTMGSNLGLQRAEDLQIASHRCDMLGLDTMSTGVTIAFTTEAYERGLLSRKDLGGIELGWGKIESILRLIDQIGRREGIGDLLAEGVKRAAEILGGDAPRFAMHTKGMETPGYEPRGMPGHALGYATGDRGGDHERSYLVHYEARGALWQGHPVEPFAREGKAELLIDQQNRTAANDTLILCHFAGEIGIETSVALLNAATGRERTWEELYRVGERVWNLTRLFNLHAGFTRADDDLPRRFKEEPLTEPRVRGQYISQQDLDFMLDDYYRLRGWDQQGVPKAEKLDELGITPVPDNWLREA
ncbi:MAG: aldehyde ferredoxin oxidoreductase family protein [Anaerolineae bacterium]